MPLRDGKRYCITHTKTRMSRTDNFKALSNVSGDAKSDTVCCSNAALTMRAAAERTTDLRAERHPSVRAQQKLALRLYEQAPLAVVRSRGQSYW
jgi:hypothetical protein